jgi:hypothetical protein
LRLRDFRVPLGQRLPITRAMRHRPVTVMKA